MSLINLPENFLYDRLPAAIVELDERQLICAVVGGYQDRLDDSRAFAKKLQLFFSPAGLPETGPNVVLVDLTTSQGRVVSRSLDITVDTPTDPARLLAWAAEQLGLEESSLANARLGVDPLRLVDANILDYLASNIGAVLYRSTVAEQQAVSVSSTGTFTATQLAHQKLLETYFPRLKFKGTARSFEALGKLLGFDDVRMVPLWGRVSPRLPSDPGAEANSPDFAETPEYYPQQVLNPFYDPHDQRDGVYYHWSGTVSNGTAATNYYPQVVNGFQPWVKFEVDATAIQIGTIAHAVAGTYLLGGGAPHCKARVAIPSTGTFMALGEGESWNGIQVDVTDLGGTLRRLDVNDRLSSIKYRTSFYNLGITMDADKADALFGTLAVRPNMDLVAAPHAFVSYGGTLYGTSPYRPFTGGTAAFDPTDGVRNSDFLVPFAGTIGYYRERVEAALSDAQQNYAALASAGQGVTQAMEEVRAATRMPRTALFGYLQDDTVNYAPIPAQELVGTVAAGGTHTFSGTLFADPKEPYSTGVSLLYDQQAYESDDRLDSRYPARIYHEISTGAVVMAGFTVPLAGSYQLELKNDGSFAGTVYVNFYGTASPIYTGYSGGTAVYGAYPNTHEVVREDAFAGTQVFAAIADYGLAANMVVNGPAWRVANRVHTWNPEAIITLGDNNYYAGDPSTIAANNEAYWPDIQRGNVFPALGNHDLNYDEGQTQVTYFFSGTVPGNGRYYNVRRGNVEFFCLNPGWSSSEVGGATGDPYYAVTLEPEGNTYDSAQGQWLRAALARSTALWKIVYFHFPPYTSSTSSNNYYPGYPRMRWPFREWGAHAVLSGHVHAYERLQIDGFPYIVMGISGEYNRVYDNVSVIPGSVVRYSQVNPTNYGALKIVATESFLRIEAWNANPSLPMIDSIQLDRPDKRYMERPEDEVDDFMLYETADEYPYRRDILGGGEVVESDIYTTGTLVEEYSVLEQTTAVKDQTEVDHDVYVAVGSFAVPQFKVRSRPLPYQPGQRAIAYMGQFKNQASLGPEDLDPYPMQGGRTGYFHSDLDNVFQPGYALFHAGLVGRVLVADPDKFNGAHHLTGLAGWLPFDEHPEGALAVADSALNLAVQSVTGVAPQDRLWDGEQGFSLQLVPGAVISSTAARECADDLTLSFWIKTNSTGGVTEASNAIEFGNVRFQLVWTSPPVLMAQVYSPELGWLSVGFGYALTPGSWSFVSLRKKGSEVWLGFSDLATAGLSGDYLNAGYSDATLASNAGASDIFLKGGTQGPWQIRDFRLWNVCKTAAELELVKHHAPMPTVVPYRIGHVLALNSGDRYALRVLPNGWLTPAPMPAWVRSPKYAKVVRYDSDGVYHGEPYRREVGLGGGTLLPTPWKLGEQGFSLTANGTVVVSPKLGAQPGSNVLWESDASGAPGSYITLSGSVTGGTLAVITSSPEGGSPWPNTQRAVNPVREAVWLDDGTRMYEARLEATATGVRFIAAPFEASCQSQGDAAAFLASAGTKLSINSAGSVVQGAYAGTVTTPPLYLYLHDTLLEDVSGAEALARWTDPTALGSSFGYPTAKESGELSFTNSSALRAGVYKLKLDIGNVGKPDDEFDGFRVDVTFADTTTSHTLLQGYTAHDLRGEQELTLELDNDIAGDWLLTLSWLNSFSDPSRGVARQLVVYGYQLRRLETNLYSVSIAGSGTVPDMTRLSVVNQQYGTVPGGWIIGVNGYGTVSSWAHEGTVYPENDTLRSQYPLANLLTGMTCEHREDILLSGTYCLPDYGDPAVVLEGRASLSGTVTDATSGSPVTYATVQITDSDGVIYTLNLDGSGHYSVSDIAAGGATASVSDAFRYYVVKADTKTLASGVNVWDFALTRDVCLFITVTNSVTSNPMAWMDVSVTQGGSTYIRTTNNNGVASFKKDWNPVFHAPLVAGSLDIAATRTGYAPYSNTIVLSGGWNTYSFTMTPASVVVSGAVSPAGSGAVTGLGSYSAGATAVLTPTPSTYTSDAYADVVFLVDESGSMETEQAWLGAPVAVDHLIVGSTYVVSGGAGIRHNSVIYTSGQTFVAVSTSYTQVSSFKPSKVYINGGFVPALLDSALAAAGIGAGAEKNQFGLLGFGSTAVGHASNKAHKHSIQTAAGPRDFGTAAEMVAATAGLVTVGGSEDGYDAMDVAAKGYVFRTNAARVFVLVTDEDRTAVRSLSVADFEAAVASVNGILVVIASLDIKDTLVQAALGRRATETYVADGIGGYTVTTFASVVSGPGSNNTTVVADYVTPCESLGGSEWDLNSLRAGGSAGQSFTAAFVAIVKDQIIQKLTYKFDHWLITPPGSTSTSNPLSIVVNEDTAVTAYFVP